MHPEVVTFGEALLRLAPPPGRRLEDAPAFDVAVGGTELNVAAGLARFGRRAAWVSRLPDNPLGRRVAAGARAAGVAVAHVAFDPDARCGLYFCEFGAAPRPGEVLYDRRDSAAAGLAPGQVDWPAALAGAAWFHVSGITPALSANAAAATAEALAAARRAGLRISVDLNYRRKLWPPEAAAAAMAALFAGADLWFATPGDAATLFNLAGDFDTVAPQLAARFGIGMVATLTRAPAASAWRERLGAALWTPQGLRAVPPRELDVVDRLGAGDAFAAGVLHGLLAGDPAAAVAGGAAAAALQHTTWGDLPTWTAAEVAAAVAGDDLRLRR